MSNPTKPLPRAAGGLNDPRSTGSRPKPRVADIAALRGTILSGSRL
jgi:hypothetical protein